MATRRKKKRLRLLPPVMIAAAVALGIGFALGFSLGGERGESAPVFFDTSPQTQNHTFTITYLVNGQVKETQQVEAGGKIKPMGEEVQGYTILRWLDPNGNPIDPSSLRAYSDIRFTAETGPATQAVKGYFPDSDRVFRPESPLTRLDFARIMHQSLVETLSGEGTLKDCEDPSALALSSHGLIDAPNGQFSPYTVIMEDTFNSLLRPFFPEAEIYAAINLVQGLGGKEISRGEAAVVLGALWGVEEQGDCYLPDVEQDYWAYDAISFAAQGSKETYPEGFVNIDGYLYHINANGYALKNAFIGSLFFDNNGRFTSGNATLDDLVAAAIRENTDPSMEREEMLRAMYNYTRDHYTYLRRNYYLTSDIGWCMNEALTMYTTGMGNCYCYASAFWAAARGLGYDALCVSGTIGSDKAPHGWVTISMDGGHYVFDVEIEMAYHKDGNDYVDNFKMEHGAAVQKWLYVEMFRYDQVLPMERQYDFEQK